MLNPKFTAYLSPSSNALSGLIRSMDRIMHKDKERQKTGRCKDETLLKLPIPHITYAVIPWSVAKKLSIDMAADET